MSGPTFKNLSLCLNGRTHDRKSNIPSLLTAAGGGGERGLCFHRWGEVRGRLTVQMRNNYMHARPDLF